jgi:hypothetical protein
MLLEHADEVVTKVRKLPACRKPPSGRTQPSLSISPDSLRAAGAEQQRHHVGGEFPVNSGEVAKGGAGSPAIQQEHGNTKIAIVYLDLAAKTATR